MNTEFQKLMQEATRLTRAGDLKASLAAVQLALDGALPSGPRGARTVDTTDIIDVDARVIAEPAPAKTAARTTDIQAAFLPGSFKNSAGKLDYKLFVPRLSAEKPVGLIVMLHGCTQNPDDFAAGTRMNELAASQNMLVLYPAQAQHANAQGCWNWFKHNHQDRSRGEPAILAGMTREVMAHYGVDPGRVFAAGLSAGGAMAAILAATHPDLFAAVGIHSGLPAGAASDLPSAFAAMKGQAGPARAPKGRGSLPTIIFHGDADTTVHASNGEAVAQAAATGVAPDGLLTQQSTANGRRCTRRLYRDDQGRTLAEHWTIHGAGHAWSGGSRESSYTDATGPDASREMLRFFGEQAR